MPEHCVPKYLDTLAEREELWNGPPILTEADKPTSFLVRGTLSGRASPSASRDALEEVEIEPRGLPERKYHEQPLRTYRARRKRDPDHVCLDLTSIIMYQGNPWYKQNGQWYRYGDHAEDTLRETRMFRRELAEPIPGLTKRAKGRFVPKAGTTDDPRRKHICPVETCKKAFTKRDHLNRHILTIHSNGLNKTPWRCNKPFCNFSAIRKDNANTHLRKHTHYHEIFMCTPEEDFRGIHLQNPRVVVPGCADIKPFKNLPIPPPALSSWKHDEHRRREGADVPLTEYDLVGKYFAAHPEEIEPCMAGHPSFEWRMPLAGPEFKLVNATCMTGRFKLDVKREVGASDVEGSGSSSGGGGGDP